jgi:hypothetical protein
MREHRFFAFVRAVHCVLRTFLTGDWVVVILVCVAVMVVGGSQTEQAV